MPMRQDCNENSVMRKAFEYLHVAQYEALARDMLIQQALEFRVFLEKKFRSACRCTADHLDVSGHRGIPKRNNDDNPRDFGLFWTKLILLFSVGVQHIHHGLVWTGGFPRWLPFVDYLFVHAGFLV